MSAHPMRSRPIDAKAVDLARRQMLSGPADREARRIFGSICDPTRLKILRALRRTPLAASDLAIVIGRTRSATSQHLRRLREAEVIVPERTGHIVRYRFGAGISSDVLADICGAFDRLAA